MNTYKKTLIEARVTGNVNRMNKLHSRRRGHPLLLGKVLDDQVKKYVNYLRKSGAVINSAIVMAVAEGIIRIHDSNLLASSGGQIAITTSCARSILHHLGFVKWRPSSKANVSLPDFEAYKTQFVHDVNAITETEEIPTELVINWDHTGIH